jgi:hypothetical protein
VHNNVRHRVRGFRPHLLSPFFYFVRPDQVVPTAQGLIPSLVWVVEVKAARIGCEKIGYPYQLSCY